MFFGIIQESISMAIDTSNREKQNQENIAAMQREKAKHEELVNKRSLELAEASRPRNFWGK